MISDNEARAALRRAITIVLADDWGQFRQRRRLNELARESGNVDGVEVGGYSMGGCHEKTNEPGGGNRDGSGSAGESGAT